MAYPVQLSQLQTRVYQRANMENQTKFASPAEVVDLINLGLARWYDEVTQVTFAGQFYRKSVQFATTNAQAVYVFSAVGMADFYKLISVDAFITTQGSNQVIDVRPYQEEQRNRFKFWPMIWIAGAPLYYQIQGQAISFTPAPPVLQIGINYMPVAPTLVNPSDTLDSWNGWEEYIVLYAAKRLAVKSRDSELLSLLSSLEADELARIRMAASSHDPGPETIHEVPEGDFWNMGGPGFD